MTGVLNCKLTHLDGVDLGSVVRVAYNLKSGWNRLTVNTVLSTVGELSVETQASTDLNGVQWAYLPANP